MQATANATTRIIDSDLLDHDGLMQRCMGNQTLVEHLLNRYMDLVSHEITSLETAVQGANRQAVRQIAHRLKGTSATVGSNRTSALAAQVEQNSATEDWALLNSIVAEIREVHATVTDYYRDSRGSRHRMRNSGGDA